MSCIWNWRYGSSKTKMTKQPQFFFYPEPLKKMFNTFCQYFTKGMVTDDMFHVEPSLFGFRCTCRSLNKTTAFWLRRNRFSLSYVTKYLTNTQWRPQNMRRWITFLANSYCRPGFSGSRVIAKAFRKSHYSGSCGPHTPSQLYHSHSQLTKIRLAISWSMRDKTEANEPILSR